MLTDPRIMRPQFRFMLIPVKFCIYPQNFQLIHGHVGRLINRDGHLNPDVYALIQGHSHSVRLTRNFSAAPLFTASAAGMLFFLTPRSRRSGDAKTEAGSPSGAFPPPPGFKMAAVRRCLCVYLRSICANLALPRSECQNFHFFYQISRFSNFSHAVLVPRLVFVSSRQVFRLKACAKQMARRRRCVPRFSLAVLQERRVY